MNLSASKVTNTNCFCVTRKPESFLQVDTLIDLSFTILSIERAIMSVFIT